MMISRVWTAVLASLVSVVVSFIIAPYVFDRDGGGPGFGGDGTLEAGGTSIQGLRAALAVDRSVPIDVAGMCTDRLGVLPGRGTTLQDIVDGWDSRLLPLPQPELQALRERRYFLGALQRDVGGVFAGWQRELMKLIYILGNEDLSNIFVSVYESLSSDLTQIELIGFEELLGSFGVPCKVVLGHEDAAHPDRDAVSRIEFLAQLRNVAMSPLLSGDDVYDSVLYLNDVLFCAADAVDLLRVVDPRGGIDADMSCAVDYIAGADDAGVGGGSGPLRLYDTWVAHDILGMNMVNDHPFMCDADSQNSFDGGEPFEVFSCWNGMAAVDADVFQELGVRFRSARNYECQLSECELLGRDMRVLGRGRLVMVPTARTAYDWDVFRALGVAENTGAPKELSLATTAGGEAVQEPKHAMCCSIDREGTIVLLETCFVQHRWRLPYEAFGVPLASARTELHLDTSSVPAGDAGLELAKQRLLAAGNDVSGGSPAAAAGAEGFLVPPRIVQWAGSSDGWASDVGVIIELSSLSYLAANGDRSFEVVSDAELAAWGAEYEGAETLSRGAEHAFRSTALRLGFLRLLYAYEHGGIFVPPASWAGAAFTEVLEPGDEMVVGVAVNQTNNERHLLFLAAAPRCVAIEAALGAARAALQAPKLTYQRMWANMEELRSLEELEERYFTGAELLFEVAASFSSSKSVRIVEHDLAAVAFDVARPEALCAGMLESGQLGHSAAAVALRAEKPTPVYFDPNTPFRVLFSGLLREDQRLGMRRSLATDALYTSWQLLPGQYLLAVPPHSADFEPVRATPAITECQAGGDVTKRCFLWLCPEGSLGVYSGMGLADPAMALVKLLAPKQEPKQEGSEAEAGPNGSAVALTLGTEWFRWLTLQGDGNLVLYLQEGDKTLPPKPLWAAGWAFPDSCHENTGCRLQSFVSLLENGQLALHRGISDAMRAYLEVGVPMYTRLRSCLYHNNHTVAPYLADLGFQSHADSHCEVPQVLKLVTFPNSGTSFTMQAAIAATGSTAYTCYEAEANLTMENTPELQDLCGKNACKDLGMCQLGRGEAEAHIPPPGHGALLKTHVTRYRSGIYCGANGLQAFDTALKQGAFGLPVDEYGFLRLFRNPFDNLVARYHMLAEVGRLKDLKYDKEGFLDDNGLFAKRDVYTYLYWHLSMNVLFKESGLPTALLTYEQIYSDPVGYLRSIVEMLGYTTAEVTPARLTELAHTVKDREYLYLDGEPVPVYIDSFYDADTVREVAAIIHEVLDATDCLSKAVYAEPRVGPIPYFRRGRRRRRRQR